MARFELYIAVLAGFVVFVIATESDNGVIGNAQVASQVITIPLVSHKTVQQRARHRSLLLSSDRNSVPKDRVAAAKRPLNSKYHYYDELQNQRRLEKWGGGGDNETYSAPNAAEQVAGLFQGYGTHYADVWCGTPIPQRQTVIIDTGSSMTAFPCRDCREHCGVPKFHIDALFDESQSTTFQKVSCNDCEIGQCYNTDSCIVKASYAEKSSWTAYEATDRCYIGGFHDYPLSSGTSQEQKQEYDDVDPFAAPNFAFDLRFGCQTAMTGLFETQLADGIMGMDRHPDVFWRQAYDSSVIANAAFSLCFARHDVAERTGTEAGALSLGGTDVRLHNTPMVFAQTVTSTTTDRYQSSSNFFVVHVRKIYLRPAAASTAAANTTGTGSRNGTATLPFTSPIWLDVSPADINSGSRNGIIVDSGSTDSYFSYKVRSEFNKAYQTLTGRDYTTSVQTFTPTELAQQPTILLQLSADVHANQAAVQRDDTAYYSLAGDLDPHHADDVMLAIPPEHYYQYDDDAQGYIPRWIMQEREGGVLGASAMMGHDVLFDDKHQRIGWAKSSCDYTKLVEDYAPHLHYIPTQNQAKRSRIDPEVQTTPNDSTSDIMCSGLACQLTVIVGLVLVAALLVKFAVQGRRLQRRSATEANASVGFESELELQTVVARDSDGSSGLYNDDEGYDDFPDRQPEGTLT